MKTLITLIVLIYTVAPPADAQFYTGKFRSEPQLQDFDQFIVVQHPHHVKYGGAVSVEAFDKAGDLWQSKAVPLEAADTDRLIRHADNSLNVQSAYDLKVTLGQEIWEFYLLGYENEQQEVSFIVVEKDMENHISDQEYVEVNTFTWDQVTAKR
ncbi:hypothetical protein N7E81_00585 [Reichenbachiella carrageenanivorans]|uniref:Uncharacterized protein n=1 Tax=Reichenbachiella carrageenanivorans TaxID=2979869 RepID=A0ABY6D0B1_9BACT|nr:hypothetical protein [Reichenbachiella carrageenanivorans]UXX79606.1 hypothetical protein N7E81_00585 [Reichenbachiella carrageenanivorans]